MVPTHAPEAPSDRLLIRVPNWIGDALMALPTILELQRQGVSVHCVGRAWLRDLFSGHDFACIPLPGRLLAARRVLKETGIRDILLLTKSFASALQARAADLWSLGYRNDYRGFLLSQALTPLKGHHEVTRFWHLGQCYLERRKRGAGADIPERVTLRIRDADLETARKVLKDHNITGPFSVWAPMSTGTVNGRNKRWPGFTTACQRDIATGRTIISCPGPGEGAATRALLPGAIIIENTSLTVCAAICRMSEGLLANDSGPMHLAAAAGARVLGIFGVSDPERTHPWGGRWIGSASSWPDADAVLEAWHEMLREQSSIRPSGRDGPEPARRPFKTKGE